MKKMFALSLKANGTVIYSDGEPIPHVFRRAAKAYRFLNVVQAQKRAGKPGALTGAYVLETLDSIEDFNFDFDENDEVTGGHRYSDWGDYAPAVSELD